MRRPYEMTKEEIMNYLEVKPNGLSKNEVESRREKDVYKRQTLMNIILMLQKTFMRYM